MQKGGERIPKEYRKFNSTQIDLTIELITPLIKDKTIAQMFEQCFPNTLDSTVEHFNSSIPDTFVITGDIDAMWQRDSTNQVFPYIQFANKDTHLKQMIKGLINRQIKNVLTDSYANAYNYMYKVSPADEDITTKLNKTDGQPENAMNLKLWERKWEIDSLGAVLKLISEYVNVTKDYSPIDTDYFIDAMQIILNTLQEQQKGMREQNQEKKIPYTFQRKTLEPTDTLSHGRGPQAQYTGMIRSAFRPSDDACTFPFHIPGNAMLVVYLEKIANIIDEWIALDKQQTFFSKKLSLISDQCNKIQKEIQAGIQKYGIINVEDFENEGQYIKVYAYEVDGFGNYIKMDDANIPSLLSLPFLGYGTREDLIYQNTRKQILLNEYRNPYFFKDDNSQQQQSLMINNTIYKYNWEGIGGPHVGDQYIWPMSIIVRAMTSDNDTEILICLDTLKNTNNNTNYMHESFFQNNPSNYTRPWFAWANTLFGDLILQLLEEKPHLIT